MLSFAAGETVEASEASPLFRFGDGLSFTTFNYSAPAVHQSSTHGDTVAVLAVTLTYVQFAFRVTALRADLTTRLV